MLSPRSPCCRPRPASPAQTFVIGNALLGRVVCDHAYLRFKHSRSRRLGLCPVHVDIMECHLEAGMLSVGCSDETIKVRKGRADGGCKGALYPSCRAGWLGRGGLGGRTGVGCSWQRSWLRQETRRLLNNLGAVAKGCGRVWQLGIMCYLTWPRPAYCCVLHRLLVQCSGSTRLRLSARHLNASHKLCCGRARGSCSFPVMRLIE